VNACCVAQSDWRSKFACFSQLNYWCSATKETVGRRRASFADFGYWYWGISFRLKIVMHGEVRFWNHRAG
jgi:hypothetical protein